MITVDKKRRYIHLVQVAHNQYNESNYYSSIERILDDYFAKEQDKDRQNDIFLLNAVNWQAVPMHLQKLLLQYCLQYKIVFLIQTANRVYEICPDNRVFSLDSKEICDKYKLLLEFDSAQEVTNADSVQDISDDVLARVVFVFQNIGIQSSPSLWFYKYSNNDSNHAKIYFNLMGSHADHLYAGGATISRGSVYEIVTPCWQEGVFAIDMQMDSAKKHGANSVLEPESEKPSECWQQVYQSMMFSLRQFIHSTGLKSCVIGLSGGIDSVLVTTLAVDSLGAQNVHAVFLPSHYTYEISHHCVNEVVELLKCRFSILNIDALVTSVHQSLQSIRKHDFAGRVLENMQARLRAMLLMAFANQERVPLLSNSNKSEIMIGYFTLFGDSCGMFAPLCDLYKTDVYNLARWRNNNIPVGSMHPHTNPIPQTVINRVPTAELRDNHLDSDDLPEYSILDYLLRCINNDKDVAKSLPAKFEERFNDVDYHNVKALMLRNRFKRKFIPDGPKFY